MIYNFLTAIFVLAMGLLAAFTAGIPVVWGVFNHKKIRLSGDHFWALAPFGGYAVIFMVLHWLVAMNIPVKYTAYPLFVITLVLTGLVFYKAKKNKQLALLMPSKKFILLLLGVCAVVGCVYFMQGAMHYKGYNWYDMTFYGPHAELVRSIPLNTVRDSRTTQEWLRYYYQNSAITHRMALGTMQAYTAQLSFVDGASTIGFISVFASVLVYCAILYITKEVKMRTSFRYAAAFFAAVLPNVVRMSLEAFISIAMYTPILLILSKLLIEIYQKRNWKLALFTGAVASAGFATLSNSFSIILAFCALSFLIVLLAGQCNWRAGLQGGIFLASFFTVTTPLTAGYIAEFLAFGSQGSLNYIYDMARTPQLFSWIFFGASFDRMYLSAETTSLYTLLAMAFTFMGFILFFLGIFGLLYLLLKQRLPEAITFMGVCAICIVFLLGAKPQSYSFCKTLSFGAPLLVFGVWYMGDVLYNQLQNHFLASQTGKVAVFCKKWAPKIGTTALAGVFVCSALCSVMMLFKILKPEDYYNTQGSNGVQYIARTAFAVGNNKAQQQLYEEAIKGKDHTALIISGQDNTGWWTNYYLRHNKVYGMIEQYGYDVPYPALRNIPQDSKLYYTTSTVRLFGSEHEKDYGGLLQSVRVDGTKYATGANYTHAIHQAQALIFARTKASAEVSFKVFSDTQKSMEMIVDGKKKTVPNHTQITFTMPLQAGAQEVDLATMVDPEQVFNLYELTFSLQ